MSLSDKGFLHWVADRLVKVHDESPNVDFVLKLRSIARAIPDNQYTPNTFEEDEQKVCNLCGQPSDNIKQYKRDDNTRTAVCPSCAKCLHSDEWEEVL